MSVFLVAVNSISDGSSAMLALRLYASERAFSGPVAGPRSDS